MQPGRVINKGKDHDHKLDVRRGPWLDFEIFCKRWRCRYREIDPRGLEAHYLNDRRRDQ